MVELGGVAFYPDNLPGVAALAEYLTQRHASWAAYFKGVFPNFDSAFGAANANPKSGVWAVIQFSRADAEVLDYSIRMKVRACPKNVV